MWDALGNFDSIFYQGGQAQRHPDPVCGGSGSTIPPFWLETPPTVTNARSYHSATLADLANASFRRLNMTIPPSWVGTPPTLTNASATLADLANESFRRLNMYTAIYLIEIAEMQTDG